MKRLLFALVIVGLFVPLTYSQDALNLPTELYILLNEGRVERYGLGADGVQAVTPESAFVIDFGIAHDDNWMAYRTTEGLTISNIYAPEDGLLVDEGADVPSIRGEGDTLVWSPDDLYIAYITLTGIRVYYRDSDVVTDIPVEQIQHLSWSPSGEFLLAETTENIWWIYRRVGTSMNLTSVIPSSTGVAWLSDTVLVFAPLDGGLFTMDLNNNNAQTTVLADTAIYQLPIAMDDGLFRVFRMTDDHFGQLIMIQVSDGNVVNEQLGEGDVELTNARWTPDGELLIAFEGGVMALVDPISTQGFTLPITSTVSYDWGRVNRNLMETLAVTDDLYFLGRDVMGVQQVWTITDDDTSFSVTPATGNISDYDISANGEQIAYVSQGQLWLYDRPSDEVTSLLNVSDLIYSPRFSPDGSRIAYAVETVDNPRNGGIWLYSIDDESNAQILANGAGSGDEISPPFYFNPQWAPNINALLVYAHGSETTSLSVLDVNTLEVVPIGQYDAGFWSQDGRVIAWGSGQGIETPQASEIVILDPNTQNEPISLFTLPEDIIVERLQQVGRNELRLISRQRLFGPSTPVLIQIPLSGTFERLSDLVSIINPLLSPDGEYVVGLTHPNGHLVIYDTELDEETILIFPSDVSNILWR